MYFTASHQEGSMASGALFRDTKSAQRGDGSGSNPPAGENGVCSFLTFSFPSKLMLIMQHLPPSEMHMLLPLNLNVRWVDHTHSCIQIHRWKLSLSPLEITSTSSASASLEVADSRTGKCGNYQTCPSHVLAQKLSIALGSGSRQSSQQGDPFLSSTGWVFSVLHSGRKREFGVSGGAHKVQRGSISLCSLLSKPPSQLICKSHLHQSHPAS